MDGLRHFDRVNGFAVSDNDKAALQERDLLNC